MQGLKNFDIFFNEFGQLTMTHTTQEINTFLNRELYDKKIENFFAKTGSLKEKHLQAQKKNRS